MSKETKYEFKGTPTPWGWEHMGGDHMFIGKMNEDMTDMDEIVCLFEYGSHMTKDARNVRYANTHLLATAPEMLDMLIKIEDSYSRMVLKTEKGEDLHAEIKTVLSKALNIKRTKI